MLNKENILLFLGMLMFFWIIKFIVYFIFGHWMEFFITNYWYFVSAGLIPAFIAKKNKFFFILWWIVGTFFPIASTIFVLACYESNDSNTKQREELASIEEANKETGICESTTEARYKEKEDNIY